MTTKIKTLVKRITPASFLNIYRGIKYEAWLRRPKYFWQGVFEHLRDVPVSGGGYEGDVWLNRVRANTERVLAESKKPVTVPAVVTGEQSLLPVTASLLRQFIKHERLSILDFGGGLGIDYISVISSVLRCQNFDYHIVDTEKSCEVGSDIFSHDKRVHFHATLPANLAVDIVYINSALLYIEDYKNLLETLCSYQAKFFLFVRLDAGDIPTHARGQINIEGSTVPCWFFNVNEIINIMEAKDYALIFKGAAEAIYEESNFSDEYKLGRACNLLFSQGGDAGQEIIEN
jgi:putative methyltransferase (TIGR04325 family)